MEEDIPVLRNSVKYFLKISLITVLPVIAGFVLKANKALSEWIEGLSQNQWWIWGGLTTIFLIEIVGRSYIFDKDKMKIGWQWLCAYFDKSIDIKVVKKRRDTFEDDYIKTSGNKPIE